jgi:hypothetical protein
LFQIRSQKVAEKNRHTHFLLLVAAMAWLYLSESETRLLKRAIALCSAPFWLVSVRAVCVWDGFFPALVKKRRITSPNALLVALLGRYMMFNRIYT